MVIISGASGGIGKLLCNHFKLKGEKVVGLYLKNKIQIPSIKFLKCDIRDFKNVNKVLEPHIIPKNIKNIILINCASINYNNFLHKSNPNLWSDIININLIGTYNLIRAVLPKMREVNNGRIINFGSILSTRSAPGTSAYSSSKSALIGLSKSIALENAMKNITINNINLGYSELGMIKEVPKKYLDEIKNKIPANRFCSSEEILKTVIYLIETEYINGESIDINGGLTL